MASLNCKYYTLLLPQHKSTLVCFSLPYLNHIKLHVIATYLTSMSIHKYNVFVFQVPALLLWGLCSPALPQISALLRLQPADQWRLQPCQRCLFTYKPCIEQKFGVSQIFVFESNEYFYSARMHRNACHIFLNNPETMHHSFVHI